MKNIFEKFEDLEGRVEEKVFECLDWCKGDSQANYNTDILIRKDGTLTTYNYFGSCSYKDNDIELVLTVSNNEKASWREYWESCMSEEQIEICEQKGWYCCYESDSDNQDELQEYKVDISDFREIENNIVEQAIERYKEEFLQNN